MIESAENSLSFDFSLKMKVTLLITFLTKLPVQSIGSILGSQKRVSIRYEYLVHKLKGLVLGLDIWKSMDHFYYQFHHLFLRVFFGELFQELPAQLLDSLLRLSHACNNLNLNFKEYLGKNFGLFFENMINENLKVGVQQPDRRCLYLYMDVIKCLKDA